MPRYCVCAPGIPHGTQSSSLTGGRTSSTWLTASAPLHSLRLPQLGYTGPVLPLSWFSKHISFTTSGTAHISVFVPMVFHAGLRTVAWPEGRPPARGSQPLLLCPASGLPAQSTLAQASASLLVLPKCCFSQIDISPRTHVFSNACQRPTQHIYIPRNEGLLLGVCCWESCTPESIE